MIKYTLECQDGHVFEGWFQSGAVFEAQAEIGQIVCPHCGTQAVEKAIMAPAVARRDVARAPLTGNQEPKQPDDAPMQALQHRLRELREEIHRKAEYVGGRFVEEARRIHLEESPPRGIYGEASEDDARELAEEGIPFFPMPRLPEDLN